MRRVRIGRYGIVVDKLNKPTIGITRKRSGYANFLFINLYPVSVGLFKKKGK